MDNNADDDPKSPRRLPPPRSWEKRGGKEEKK